MRRMLTDGGLRYRLHRRDLPGTPDLVLAKYRIAVFVHGCFWHCHPRCHKATIPAANRQFWKDKLSANVRRDARNELALLNSAWRVLVIWECAVRDRSPDQIERLTKLICAWIRSRRLRGEYPGRFSRRRGSSGASAGTH